MTTASSALPAPLGSPVLLDGISTREWGARRRRRSVRHAAPFLSVVIPIYNERGNLPALLKRLERTLGRQSYASECIFVDDGSTDGSAGYLRTTSCSIALRILEKKGRRGKSQSLQEGIAAAGGSVIAMIDGDLQYPPEAIPSLVKGIGAHDIVIARRTRRRTKMLRSLLSHSFNFFVGRLLLSLPVDVQSGLKVFRRETAERLTLSSSPWGFDYQFLFQAKKRGWTIGERPIIFEERFHGRSHVRTVRDGLALAGGAFLLRLRFTLLAMFPFLSKAPHEPLSPDTDHAGDFLFLPPALSVKKQIRWETVSLVIVTLPLSALAVLWISRFLAISPLVFLSGMVSALYVTLLAFKLYVVRHALQSAPLQVPPEELSLLRDEDLPLYTVIIPLYQEAEVIPQIRAAMTAIDYPPEKLDIIITLEEYDHATREAIEAAGFPPHFRVLTLPDVEPKTKPKALNVAFREARGEFLVIYDAEIVPDRDQMKKAVAAFRRRPDLDCLQTRLDHYNAGQNWITKLFNAEFSFYYDLFLPGLQSLGYPLPLSGHSTHFRTQVLRDIGAWDPYNVTEDCDVGIRLYRFGCRSDILDSFSREEATCTLDAWVKQRSRWVKGFVQTAIVHMRHPIALRREIGGWKNLAAFLITVPGSVIVNALNLGYWVLLAAWVITQSTAIQQFFPAAVLYPSVASFLAGNFIFTYCNLLGSYRRKRFAMVKYSLLSPVYWILLAYATVRGMAQMVLRPHHWEKTQHGKHLFEHSYALTLPPEMAFR